MGAWPRLNNFSFWLLAPSVMCLLHRLFQRRIGSGWTMYPPLSRNESQMDAMIFSLHLAGLSSIFGAINFITTFRLMGPKGYCIYNLHLYLWCMGVTTFMLLTTLPVLAAAITMILFDRHFNSAFFNVTRGGDPILFQHLFWFFRHPEGYVLILPRFGMLSHVLAHNSSMERPFGYYRMVWSILAIGFLRFIVWAHHMVSVGMDTDSKAYFSVATVVIRIPTGVKVFAWLAHFNMTSLELTVEVMWGYLLCSSTLPLCSVNGCCRLTYHESVFLVSSICEIVIATILCLCVFYSFFRCCELNFSTYVHFRYA